MHRTILITGAASGIGRATALLFASKGWFTCLFDMNRQALEQVCSVIGPEKSCCYAVDVRSHEDIENCVKLMARKTEHRLDVLFNCAGVLFMGPHAGIGIAEQKKTVDVNIGGILNMIDTCLPLLEASGNGVIINMSSASAIYGTPELAVYSATKHAVRGLTEALNIEFEPLGVHVCDIMAPYVRTPMIMDADRKAASVSRLRVNLTPEQVAETVFQACFRKKIHWKVGMLLRAMSAGTSLMPFASRFLTRMIAFSSAGSSAGK